MNSEDISPGLIDRELGPVTILFGHENGKYPHGNSPVVRGTQSAALIDPCLGVVARKGRLPQVDMIVHSHIHEDHIAGTHLFPDVPWHAHALDAPGLDSIDAMMEIYGFEGETRKSFQEAIETTFFYPGNNAG